MLIEGIGEIREGIGLPLLRVGLNFEEDDAAESGREMWNQMLVIYNSLVEDVIKATYVFNSIARWGVPPDVQSYNIIINGLCKNKLVERFYDVCDLWMRCTIEINQMTLSLTVLLLDALCKSDHVDKGGCIIEKDQRLENSARHEKKLRAAAKTGKKRDGDVKQMQAVVCRLEDIKISECVLSMEDNHTVEGNLYILFWSLMRILKS
ncbi:PPR repeat protein [Medicago truncatula]|uniref:PPR repeat protein n=1 Tax=Medicago truncatula TaxID=3880 RepID=A0A072TXJ9_MEDTR|nr:PPR repeat protein [Medicago truncatula]